MPSTQWLSLRSTIDDSSDRYLWAADAALCLGDLVRGTSLGGSLPELVGKSVLLASAEQLTAALALIEIDGIARRVVICPPDLPADFLPQLAARAEVDAIVTDGTR